MFAKLLRAIGWSEAASDWESEMRRADGWFDELKAARNDEYRRGIICTEADPVRRARILKANGFQAE